MLINLIDKNCAKILLFLIISPGSKYRRKEIKDKTLLNNIPLDISLKKLIALRIIKKKDKLYSLNLEDKIIKLLLEEKNLLMNLPLMVQYQILDLNSRIIGLESIENIILFGSYSKLIFSDKSDIDIAIILKNKIKNKTKIGQIVSRISKNLFKKYKKEIHIHLFFDKDLKYKRDPLIKDILRNGMILI